MTDKFKSKAYLFQTILKNIRKTAWPELTGFSAQKFCEPEEKHLSSTMPSGCSKYHEMCIIPPQLKNKEINEIKQNYNHIYQKLEQAHCWRIKKEWCKYRLEKIDSTGSYANFPNPFGCLELPGQPGGCGKCEENGYRFRDCIPCECSGCVTPEMQKEYNKKVNYLPRSEYWQWLDACPYFYRYKGPGFSDRVTNPLRFLQCYITRSEFLELQRRLGIFSVAQVYIEPARISVFAGDKQLPVSPVFYMSKNPISPIHYVVLDTEDSKSDGPNRLNFAHQVRFHTPKLARSHETINMVEALQREGVIETLSMFLRFAHGNDLGPFERRERVLRVSDGEFSFLRLKWTLLNILRHNSSNGFSSNELIQWVNNWETTLIWTIEEDSDQQTHQETPQILRKLRKLGQYQSLKRLFGHVVDGENTEQANTPPNLIFTKDRILRSASAKDEFEFLGLIDATERPTIKLLSLCLWLQKTIDELLVIDPPEEYKEWRQKLYKELSVSNWSRNKLLSCRKEIQQIKNRISGILRAKKVNRDKVVGILSRLVTFLLQDIDVSQTPHLISTTAEFFPLYPLVHHIMFAKITDLIQWVAIPWGRTTLIIAEGGLPCVIPQGVFMLLIRQNVKEKFGEMAESLDQIELLLSSIADREQAVLKESASSRLQLLKAIKESFEQQLKHVGAHANDSIFQIQGESQDHLTPELIRLGIGYIFMNRMLTNLNNLRFDLNVESKENIYYFLKELTRWYSEAAKRIGADFEIDGDRAVSIRTTPTLLEIVLDNCIHNILEHDFGYVKKENEPYREKKILIRIEHGEHEHTCRLLFWNVEKTFPERVLSLFNENMELLVDKHGNGLFICRSIVSWLGGSIDLGNYTHPLTDNKVGRVSITLPI